MATVTCPQIKVFHWNRTRDRSEGFPSLPLQPGGGRKPAQLVGLHGKPQEGRNGGSWLYSWTIQDYHMEKRPDPLSSHLNASTAPLTTGSFTPFLCCVESIPLSGLLSMLEFTRVFPDLACTFWNPRELSEVS